MKKLGIPLCIVVVILLSSGILEAGEARAEQRIQFSKLKEGDRVADLSTRELLGIVASNERLTNYFLFNDFYSWLYAVAEKAPEVGELLRRDDAVEEILYHLQNYDLGVFQRAMEGVTDPGYEFTLTDDSIAAPMYGFLSHLLFTDELRPQINEQTHRRLLNVHLAQMVVRESEWFIRLYDSYLIGLLSMDFSRQAGGADILTEYPIRGHLFAYRLNNQQFGELLAVADRYLR